MRYRLRHDRLRQELARRRISQNRWAQILGLTKSHLSMLVNGHRPYPEEPTRRKLQEGLGLRLDELFEVVHDELPPPERNFMESLLQDLRHGYRALRARPLLVSVVVLTLALGIGATTAVYSVIDATLLRPMPFPEPGQLVRLFGGNPEYGDVRGQLSMANTLDWRERTRAFEDIALYRGRTFNVSGNGDPQRTLSLLVSDRYLELLGIAPARGRLFTADEHRPGGAAVALISDAMWSERFDRSPTAVGASIRVDTTEHVIVGVLPPEFADVRLTLGWDVPPDLVLPLALEADVDRGAYWLLGIGRLAPGLEVASAQDEADEVAAWLRTQYPDDASEHQLTVVPLAEFVAGDVRPRLLLFLVAAVLVLMVGCVNVANLMLAYATSRRREVAIRKALGAGRARLARLTLIESALLAGIGGVGGLLLAAALLRLAAPMLPVYLARHDLVGIDPRAAGFAAAVSLVTALVFGLVPAAGAARTSARDELAGAGITGTRDRSRARLLQTLAVAQIAMAGMLAIGSGLVVKSYTRLVSVDPGFDPNGLLTFYTIPRYSFGTREEQHDFVEALETRLAALPGVERVGEINFMPFTDNEAMQGIEIEGREQPEGVTDVAQSRAASAGFFNALGIAPLAGRTFEPQDMVDADVAVIDEAMAERYWPGTDPLGARLRAGGETWYRIVGVVPNIKWHGYDDVALPHLFLPYRTDPWSSTRGFLLRTRADPLALAPAVRAAVQELSPNQSIYSIETMEQRLATSAAGTRFSLSLLVALGATALLLAVVGTYGLFANSVVERRAEIGVRLALGAESGQVARGVLGQSLVLAALGTALAWLGSRYLAGTVTTFLFEVDPGDLTVTLGATTAILLSGVAAAWLPARRAAAVDPASALRD